MKRGGGTKHRGAKPKESAFLTEAKRLITTCAVQRTRQVGEYMTPTPYGTVKVTITAEMLVHAAQPPQIVRPT